MKHHTYQSYSDSMELAYHLHYDHGFKWADAVAMSDSERVATHQGAHA